MPQSIKEWLARDDIREIREKHTQGELASKDFFRDPLRSITINNELLYAHADGVVLYAQEYQPEDFLDIKGREFTLKQLLADSDYDIPSLVIGIFMSQFDIHVNRVPASCYYLDVQETNQIYTHGISMIMMENDLLKDKKLDSNDLGYLVCNEKQASLFYCPAIKGRFYLVQIADKDVDVIINFNKGKHLIQGDRFGAIRYGSQVDLVIPLTGKVDFEVLCEPLQHLEAGIDPILRVVNK